MLEPGMLWSMAMFGMGVVVWAVRIEGRVNGHERLFEEREKLSEARHAEISSRLIRIESKLDRAETRYSDKYGIGDTRA